MFLNYFPHSLLFFQNDGKGVMSSRWIKVGDTLTVENGLSPMYTVNGFFTSKEEGAVSLSLRGDKPTPKTPRFKENLSHIQAFYCDIDVAKEGEAVEGKRLIRQKLIASDVPPTIIVDTKNGLQALWILEEPLEVKRDKAIVDEYVAIQEGIIEYSKTLGAYGDKVKDVTRVLRLPNFNHLKNPKEPYMVTYDVVGDRVRWEHMDFFKTFTPQKKSTVMELDFTPVSFDSRGFDLAESINSHIDIREAVRSGFAAVGRSFEEDKTGRWILDGRLTGNFFSKEGKNVACTTSGAEPYSGPPFAVLCQIFEANGRTRREAAQYMNETWGRKLEKIFVKASPIVEDNSDYLSDWLCRRYANCCSWGVDEVDLRGGLITPSRVIILGGQHGVGKSTFITELARHNAESGKKTALVPLEMGVDFTLMTLTVNQFNLERDSSMKFMSYGEVDEGYLYLRSKEELEIFKKSYEKIKNIKNLEISCPAGNSFTELMGYLEKKAAEGVKFFVIDHLHQLAVEGDSETQFYSNVAKELKRIAEEYSIALVCIVQLTKTGNSSAVPVDLSSFKGTSEFTSNAHRVAIVRRPVFKAPKDKELKDEIKALGGVPTMEALARLAEEYEINFEKNTQNIREVTFLKTRGREGGTITIQLEKGRFSFLNYDSFRGFNKPLNAEVEPPKDDGLF